MDSLSFVNGKPFHPNLMSTSRAEAYLSETPFRSSTVGYVPALTPKYQTRLKTLARDKHFSLFCLLVNYNRRGFYSTWIISLIFKYHLNERKMLRGEYKNLHRVKCVKRVKRVKRVK